jgi:cell division transport system permease protein
VDQNLRMLFERALDDEPVPPPGDLAQEAMAEGARLRRRRGLLAGGSAAGVLAVLITVVALNLTAPRLGTTAESAAIARPASSACVMGVRQDATDVAIFLRADITDRQTQDVYDALRSDPLVLTTTFESREQAFQKFKTLWRDSPDLIRAVSPESMPTSFRVTLAEPAQFPAFEARFKGDPGVTQIVGSRCPAGSPTGAAK